jgi:hypothetical protein
MPGSSEWLLNDLVFSEPASYRKKCLAGEVLWLLLLCVLESLQGRRIWLLTDALSISINSCLFTPAYLIPPNDMSSATLWRPFYL